MKTKKTLIVALTWACSLLLPCSGVWAWEAKIAGGGANAVTVDAAGNAVTAGTVDNSFSVIKFDGVTGRELWRQVINGNVNSRGTALAVTGDAAGNVIAAGGTNIIIGVSNDFTVVKLDGVSGAELWRNESHGSANGQDSANAVAVDAAGNVVVAGNTVNIGSSSDITVVKFNGATGAELWRQIINGTDNGSDWANAVAVDAAGNVVAAGVTDNTGTWDFTVVKFDGATGTKLWQKDINGINGAFDYANALAVDEAGNVVVAGATSDVTNGVGDENFTVIKFDGTSGAELWRKLVVPLFFDGSGLANGSGWANAVAVDAAGNVVAAGHSHVPNTGTFSDFTVVKFDGASGTELWRNRIHAGANDLANAVAVDAAGNVVAAGITQNLNTGIDFTVVKFDGVTGQELWRQLIDGSGSDSYDNYDSANAVVVDAAGNVVAVGDTYSADTGNDFTVVKLPGTPTQLLGLAANVASPQNLGTSITFTATATDGIAPLQYKWWLFSVGVWSVLKDWSTSSSFTWTAGFGGDYRIGVWVKSSGNSADAPENNANASIAFTINPPPALTLTGIGSDQISPQPAGTTITFTATPTGGLAPLQYKWWVYNGATWSMVKDWSTSSSFNWTAGVGGNYRIGVWVKSSGNPVDYPEGNANASIPFDINPPPALVIAALTADQASPQPAGSTINFTAATTGGLAPHKYKWWVYDGNSWSVAKDWSTSSGFTWTAGVGGNYRIGVWVKSNLNPADSPENNANSSIAFTINPPPALTLTGINSDQSSPQPAGSTITFTATTSGGLAPHQYKWWVYDGVTWSMVGDWSTSNVYTWAPGLIGGYRVGVWVKSNLNPADAPEGNAYNSVAFTVTPLANACLQC